MHILPGPFSNVLTGLPPNIDAMVAASQRLRAAMAQTIDNDIARMYQFWWEPNWSRLRESMPAETKPVDPYDEYRLRVPDGEVAGLMRDRPSERAATQRMAAMDRAERPRSTATSRELAKAHPWECDE
jgi:hypothetical protein